MTTGSFHLDDVARSYSFGEQAVDDALRLARRGDVVVDIETDGLGADAYGIKVVVISDDTRAAVLDAHNPAHRAAAAAAIETAPTLIFHSSPFDVPHLVHAGMMKVEHTAKVVDTLVTARMAWPGEFVPKKLDALEQRLLGATLRTAEKGSFAAWAKLHGYTKAEAFKKASYADPVYRIYAGWDGVTTSLIRPLVHAAAVARLTDHPFGRLGADREIAEYLIEREQRVNRIMLRRSALGLRVDTELLDVEQQRLLGLMCELEVVLGEAGVDRPTNRNDLIDALGDDLPVDWPQTEGGKPSTAGKNLAKLDHPAARAFVAYDDHRRLLGYLSSAEAVAKVTGGRVHPQVGVMKAATGRMSYSDPALQQFTDGARRAILAEEGESLTSLDWSQIEPVVAANLAKDTVALEAYETGDGDLYAGIASSAGITRKQAKTALLAQLYGQGVRSLAANLGISQDEAKRLRTKVSKAVPRTTALVLQAEKWVKRYGAIFTLSGRVIPVDWEYAYKGRDYLVQGSAYDVLAETTVAVDDAGLSEAIYLSMHDELVVESSAAVDIRRIMETPPDRMVEVCKRTPILRTDSAELGTNWRAT